MSKEWVETYHGDNRATWACSMGHTWKGVLIPRRGQGRFVGEAGRKFMAHYWRKDNALHCPTSYQVRCRKCRAFREDA